MKKLLLIILIIFCSNCGPDCPPCHDQSGNLGISAEHWEIFKCAGPEWPKYVRDHVRCAYFQELINDDNFIFGSPDCECDIVYIKKVESSYKSPITFECSKIIHEATHLEYHCVDDEESSLRKEQEFQDSVILNNCIF